MSLDKPIFKTIFKKKNQETKWVLIIRHLRKKKQELVALIIKAQDFCNDGHTRTDGRKTDIHIVFIR